MRNGSFGEVGRYLVRTQGYWWRMKEYERISKTLAALQTRIRRRVGRYNSRLYKLRVSLQACDYRNLQESDRAEVQRLRKQERGREGSTRAR
eukprot:388590-Alexandrium_andersonii.AAC.1